jgi:endonuclease-3
MERPRAALRRKAERIDRALEAYYGIPARWRLDPLSELVLTVLSQNTSDVNSWRAFERLRERFPTWEAVRDAPVEAVEEAIRPAGLAAQKAPRIQAILRRINEERGELSLDFLADWPVEEAKAYLRRLNGVGPKTAAIVLLFFAGQASLPGRYACAPRGDAARADPGGDVGGASPRVDGGPGSPGTLSPFSFAVDPPRPGDLQGPAAPL